jgi:hypothetical protein
MQATSVTAYVSVILAGAVLAACTKSTPTAPGPAVRAAVTVASVSVTGERASDGGYVYRVVLHLRESAGVAATVDAVDLMFMDGTSPMVSSRHEQPVPATGNVIPPKGAADTRELVATDARVEAAYATNVRVRLTFTDPSGAQTASALASVPPLPQEPSPPLPMTYTLTGIITDQATGSGIDGARVEVLNGVNGGTVTATNSSGAYTLAGLQADTFRIRASAAGYNPGEQNVTVPAIPRADMALRRTVTPCTYTVTPTGTLNVPYVGGQFSLAVTRTSGTCDWQATTDTNWISLASTSGSGNATVAFSIPTNMVPYESRTGVITIAWSGGTSTLTVKQAGDAPNFCVVLITVNGATALNVPASGGQYTAYLEPYRGPGQLCLETWTPASTPALLSFSGPASGRGVPAWVTFTVPANGTGTLRMISFGITFPPNFQAEVHWLTIRQAGS